MIFLFFPSLFIFIPFFKSASGENMWFLANLNPSFILWDFFSNSLKNKEKKNYSKIKSKIFVKSKYDTNKKKFNGVQSISSVSGYGIENLIKTISSKLQKKPISGPVFSRERHLASLNKSLVLLKNLDLKEIDIAAENVRRSIIYIDGINQKFDIEKILDIIFSDFCIGK